jgi:RNA polymerase sigma-70 factor, ECF subfamily
LEEKAGNAATEQKRNLFQSRGVMPREQQMEVLERFASGELEAFEILFREFQGEVYRCTYRIVRDAATAEDLTVEAFWRIYRSRARFDPSRSFKSWARRIATNLALDHLRSARPHISLPENLAQPWPKNPALAREARERIEQAFSALPPKLRTAAVLALIEEKSYEEIAEELGLSIGAVKSRIFRAVRLLRKKLERLGVTP